MLLHLIGTVSTAVILGWDKGVATMKKGEKAILECAPEYAYGDAGAGGIIPPKATLLFEVEVRARATSRLIDRLFSGYTTCNCFAVRCSC